MASHAADELRLPLLGSSQSDAAPQEGASCCGGGGAGGPASRGCTSCTSARGDAAAGCTCSHLLTLAPKAAATRKTKQPAAAPVAKGILSLCVCTCSDCCCNSPDALRQVGAGERCARSRCFPLPCMAGGGGG